MSEPCTDLERFMRGEMELGAFAHREHLRMGFEMLRRYDFAETLFRWYPRQRLASDAAKRTFLLPEPRCTIVADVNKH
ncbi:MAG TPA: hypothetical protein VME21_03980 [Steroidobacteraceae bacterium]|nr:hypothetical protein [Steroidobacteraceae bacterium]